MSKPLDFTELRDQLDELDRQMEDSEIESEEYDEQCNALLQPFEARLNAADFMLETLELTLKWFRDYHYVEGAPVDETLFQLDDRLVAAIAKAKGGLPHG